VAKSLGFCGVIETLAEVMVRQGIPERIRSDSDPWFGANELRKCLGKVETGNARRRLGTPKVGFCSLERRVKGKFYAVAFRKIFCESPEQLRANLHPCVIISNCAGPIGATDVSARERVPVEFTGPLVGLGFTRDLLGVFPVLALAPGMTSLLRSVLGPQPGPLHLVDRDEKPAVVFRQWHVRPVGDYVEKAAPRLLGCDLIVRPDVWEKIVRIGGMTGISTRSFTSSSALEAAT